MRLYISGPMRGYEKFNYPAFDKAALRLGHDGVETFNPAAHDREIYPDIESWDGFASGDTAQCPKFNLPASLSWDFAAIAKSDGIVLMPGWENSTGAKAERFVAEVTGKMVFYYHPTEHGYTLTRDFTTNRMAYPQLVMP